MEETSPVPSKMYLESDVSSASYLNTAWNAIFDVNDDWAESAGYYFEVRFPHQRTEVTLTSFFEVLHVAQQVLLLMVPHMAMPTSDVVYLRFLCIFHNSKARLV
jgi:hypothetical protein